MKRYDIFMMMMLLLLILLPTTGCLNSFNNALLDPSAVGSFTREATLDIRSTLSIQDTPDGLPGSSEPTPADLVPIVRDYHYLPGDAVLVRMFELQSPGTSTDVQAQLDERGLINLPVVGRIRASGLSTRELEDEISEIIVERGHVVDPEVIITPLQRRGNSYTLTGTVSGPGVYPIPKPDWSLLDALSIAGGVNEGVTEIYIFRNLDSETPVPSSREKMDPGVPAGTRSHSRSSRGMSSGSMRGASAGASGEVWSSMSDGIGDTVPSGATMYPIVLAQNNQTQDPPQQRSGGSDAETQEILDAMFGEQKTDTQSQPERQPSGQQDQMQNQPTQQPPAETMQPGTQPEVMQPRQSDTIPPVQRTAAPIQQRVQPYGAASDAPRWHFSEEEGKWVQDSKPAPPPLMPPPPPLFDPEAEAKEELKKDVDWSEIARSDKQRIIRVNPDALRDGDPRQNVILRDGDMVRLSIGDIGEYYMMGQVFRPGAYSLTGRKITIKQAVAGAGNLAPLAWPDRATVYRRFGDREEMIQINIDRIFAGKDPDFYLKKDDVVIVGSHPAAPFLAVIRNAFRVSYGFGFVYDRNFADVDSIRRQLQTQSDVVNELQQNQGLGGLFN